MSGGINIVILYALLHVYCEVVQVTCCLSLLTQQGEWAVSHAERHAESDKSLIPYCLLQVVINAGDVSWKLMKAVSSFEV